VEKGLLLNCMASGGPTEASYLRPRRSRPTVAHPTAGTVIDHWIGGGLLCTAPSIPGRFAIFGAIGILSIFLPISVTRVEACLPSRCGNPRHTRSAGRKRTPSSQELIGSVGQRSALCCFAFEKSDDGLLVRSHFGG
jgi:hypothetical protein